MKLTPEDTLNQLWGEIQDLESTENLLEWDQETQMPPRGRRVRGKMLATIAGIKHQKLTDPAMADALEACAERALPGSQEAARVRCVGPQVERAHKVPEALTRALAEARSRGRAAWREAREESKFELFTDPLSLLLKLKREEAVAISPAGNSYDGLLDIYEPGATEEELVPLFADLRAALGPLVRAVRESGIEVDEAAAKGAFPQCNQLDFSWQIAIHMGFDPAAGRLDPATHPFCVGINPGDVRLTWRWEEDDFRPGLYGVLHEMGHGLYEQGLPVDRSPVGYGEAVSLGIHESQSRLWENHVGRSRGFWCWAMPRLEQAFPDLPAIDIDALWPALHTVKPSFIRVEADEATYNLHIAVRFELERALVGGSLEVPDLPLAWDDLYHELLGIRPDNAAEGVLQDIHWAQGTFGYFPTYTLGTMAAAQLFSSAEKELGDQEEAFARGEFKPLLDWLRREIHQHGSHYPAAELIERASGKPLAADDQLSYLQMTCTEAYGLS
jgi:carboxypeptidase Taq